MMKSAILSVLVASVSAFAPSSQVRVESSECFSWYLLGSKCLLMVLRPNRNRNGIEMEWNGLE
jgi:hypothetical protein